jgi:hypothetical protein
MLPHKDYENVLRINRAAASLKPILQQTLLYLHNTNVEEPSSRLENYHPRVLASAQINETAYRSWNRSHRTIASRVAPIWGPLDRLSLGLIFREIGSRLYQPSMILACSELILESFLTTAAPNSNNSSEHFDEFIDLLKEMIMRNRMEGEDRQDPTMTRQEGEGSPMSQVDHLLLQSKRLMKLFEYAVEVLELSSEFERPFVYTGHDVKKVLVPSPFPFLTPALLSVPVSSSSSKRLIQ